MKQVFKIYVEGKFRQYLLKSEVRYIQDMCKSFGQITVELVEITLSQYKLEFGK